jgi:hypothetical protein
MHDRIQLIAASVLSFRLSDQPAARGQAICMLGQTLAQQAVAGEYGGLQVIFGAMLVVAACGMA